MSEIPKKISISVLILAVIVSASFFYFSVAKESASRNKNMPTNNSSDKHIDDIDKTSEEAREVKIIFLGDMMFDRYIRQVVMRRGNDFILEKIRGDLASADLVVGNLEGPITSKDSVSVGTKEGEARNYVFTFDPSWAGTLYGNNIRLVNLGNNHILNQKTEGVDETKGYLDEASVEFFGDAGNSDQANYAIKEIKGNRIGFINYNQFSPGSLERSLETISDVKNKTDVIVIFTHWGVEYADSPKDNIKNLAHEFIDRGADLIIGTHPHVIQGKEEYKGKMIYYSLGNFIFDQYFDPRTQKGLVIKATIGPGNGAISFEEKRVKLMKSGQTMPE
jgi:poly-gamma-glutamate capsule biosynthesis protein CapA/YwtB (metallophosphatase superfamily)